MTKTDLTKDDKVYYRMTQTPEIVNVDSCIYVVLSGKGDPNGEEFSLNTQALYAAAYAVKNAYKALEKDFAVSKLEGEWQSDATDIDAQERRDSWRYKLRIRVPDFVEKQIATQAISAAAKKKANDRIGEVAVETIRDGQCIQALHVGPYSDEPTTMKRMDETLAAASLSRAGSMHVEIYISDPRKTEASKLKTLLRFPAKATSQRR